MNRRAFLQSAAALCAAGTYPLPATAAHRRPNIILMMADDLGYGDTGFNGNAAIQTPHLDAMRGEGMRFTRFYAGGPVCSPTRATCLTGRHYLRMGIVNANDGRLPAPEISLAEVCRASGYRTGHFGKWHLGTLTKTEKDSNRGGPESAAFYAPPWEHGFDTCFSTEALVPTWDPARTPAENKNQWGEPGSVWRSAYWHENGQRATENLEGDDSRVILDRVEPFIREAAAAQQPFLSVIWFHTPHAPTVGGPADRERYAHLPEPVQHYYACVTALDEQAGRLNVMLKELGQEENTLIFFASDNGPEGTGDGALTNRCHGSTGGLRGRKRSLFNGGITVPAFVKWPGVVQPGATCTVPCSTLDYFPTVSALLQHAMSDARPMDGVNLLPLLQGDKAPRTKPIPFHIQDREKYMFGAPTFGLIENRYKLLTHLAEDQTNDMLFDMEADPEEQHNIVATMPEIAVAYRAQLEQFVASCRESHEGRDYTEPYSPLAAFKEPLRAWST